MRTGVPVSDIMNIRGVASEAVRARTLACVVMREVTHMSYPEIARAMGYRSHGAVINAINRWLATVDRYAYMHDVYMRVHEDIERFRKDAPVRWEAA